MHPRVAQLQRSSIDTALQSARNMQQFGTVAYSGAGFMESFEEFFMAGWESIELIARVEGYSE